MLKIGDTINLEPIYNPSGEKYKCRLVERIDNKLYIDYPINEETGKTVYLLNGTQLKAFFIENNTSVYFFDTTVLGRVKQSIPMIVISYPEDESLFRIQRRQYVRVETPVDVAIESIQNEFNPFVSITHDISAGGASLILPTKVDVEPGTVIKTLFVLPSLSEDNQYITLNSKVIRKVEGKKGERNKISTQFIDTTENEQQLLIRFCFERQLEMKKRGIQN
ncbi:flagellar brake protein [Ferdinandcohnia quinoae]|uniref:Flagellar brake domain-containing protein n=1 Tax=Fredinandcohnia quinoae TaxID=2918902 RepID=A0AAW5E6K5_9BACI|nr:flagellar brake domain-containing protein [Fredinandcohnia sp. SECRCQ15]MCH1624768.1 flagellar brake domain-containing protein [Fredinandcohnia sp. SECRCQ15]